MLTKLKLHLISAFVAGLLGGTSALLGAVTQMMSDGKTEIADISGLVWLVAILSFVLAFGKDVQAYLKGGKGIE